MAFFKTRIIGAERVELTKFVVFRKDLHARLRKVVLEKAQELLGRARSKVSGEVLATRKGKLLRSLKARFYDTERGPGAKVFSSWFIARFYEVGFGGKTVSVRPHTRAVKSRNVSGMVEGKNGKLRKKKVAQGIAFVKASDRKVPLTKKPFLRASLDEMRGSIRESFKQAAKAGS